MFPTTLFPQHYGLDGLLPPLVANGLLLLALLRFVCLPLLALLRRVLYGGPGDMPKRYGEWAIVTGASDGIGLAYAKELARKGMKVMLISRTEAKLQAAVETIKAKVPKAELAYLVCDFSTPSSEWFDRLKGELEAKGCSDVGVLVNNVGVSYPHAEYLHRLPHDKVDQLIAMNVEATTWMTQLVVGDDKSGMAGRKRGAIVNITSAAGVSQCGDPFYAVYSGTKAYVAWFSRSLAYELAFKKVHVQCQVPWFVESKLSKARADGFMVIKADAFAKAAVSHIGRTSGGAVVTPYWTHAVQALLVESLPEWVAAKVFVGHHTAIMKKAYKKYKDGAKFEF